MSENTNSLYSNSHLFSDLSDKEINFSSPQLISLSDKSENNSDFEENNRQFCEQITNEEYEKNYHTERELINLGQINAEINFLQPNENIEQPSTNNKTDEYQLDEKAIINFLEDYSEQKTIAAKNTKLLSLMFKVSHIHEKLKIEKKNNQKINDRLQQTLKNLKYEKENNLSLTQESEETCKELDEKDIVIKNKDKEIEDLKKKLKKESSKTNFYFNLLVISFGGLISLYNCL